LLYLTYLLILNHEGAIFVSGLVENNDSHLLKRIFGNTLEILHAVRAKEDPRLILGQDLSSACPL
jgi:hypothetical protein